MTRPQPRFTLDTRDADGLFEVAYPDGPKHNIPFKFLGWLTTGHDDEIVEIVPVFWCPVTLGVRTAAQIEEHHQARFTELRFRKLE